MKKTLLALLVTAAAAGTANAAVYSTASNTPGNQNWGGTLGLDFTVTTPIEVTSLGVFDSGKDGITTNITAAIFRTSGVKVGPTIDFNGTANAGGSAYVYQNVTPFVLGVGSYQIGAWNFNTTDQNYNSSGGASLITFDNLGGKITADGSHYANDGDGNVLAYNQDEGVAHYGAGSFTAIDVPANVTVPPPPPPPPVLQSPGVFFGPNNLVSNQAWTGSLGMDFTITHTIRVSGLGVFDAGRNGITANLFTGIYNAAGVLVSPLANFNGAANANHDAYVFQTVTAFNLAPGTYQVASFGFHGANGDYNTSGTATPFGVHSLGGILTATGEHFNDPGVTGMATGHPDSGYLRYGAGSFLATVPEPASWVLMIAGFGLAGAGARTRRRTIAA